LSGLFVWIVVHNPLRELETGTERIASGQLGYQIPVHSHDEVGELAQSFNDMSNRCRWRRRKSPPGRARWKNASTRKRSS
jgi:HAMP domain-containing protein